MLQTVRLPHVRFDTQVLETKDAEGHILFNNVYFAYITPAGGKDEVVKRADEWLADLKQKSQVRGPFDAAANEYDTWYERFSKGFEQYKAGQEMTCNGTPLRASLAFTKAEVAQAESVRIFSIEDLAACNEEAIGRMSMNGRGLKMKAAKLLEDKASGHLAQENEALRMSIAALEEKVNKMLAAGVQEPVERKKPGRKPKAA